MWILEEVGGGYGKPEKDCGKPQEQLQRLQSNSVREKGT